MTFSSVFLHCIALKCNEIFHSTLPKITETKNSFQMLNKQIQFVPFSRLITFTIEEHEGKKKSSVDSYFKNQCKTLSQSQVWLLRNVHDYSYFMSMTPRSLITLAMVSECVKVNCNDDTANKLDRNIKSAHTHTYASHTFSHFRSHFQALLRSHAHSLSLSHSLTIYTPITKPTKHKEV